MDEGRKTEFWSLIYTYEDPRGNPVEHEVLYNPDLDQFLLSIEEEEFFLRRYIKEDGLQYTRHNGMIYVPLEFFRRIAAMLPDDETEKDVSWIDAIEQNGRRHLIATNFQGGEIRVAIH